MPRIRHSLVIGSREIRPNLRENKSVFAKAMSGLEISTDPGVCGRHAHDAAAFASAQTPTVVVFPRSVAQVQQVMRAATLLGMPVVPQGVRTGLAGAANSVDGCMVMSLTKMDKILEIDPVNQLARVQPGVLVSLLDEALAPHGLRHSSELEPCTIGGRIATGASGVKALSVVLADGRLAKLGAGYGLTHLFVGSEGTLGIIVEATLALQPRTGSSSALLAQFATTAEAGDAIEMIVRNGHTPCSLELLDRAATEAVAQLGLLTGSGVTLSIESDSPDRTQQVAMMGQLCDQAGASVVSAATDDVCGLVVPALKHKMTTMPGKPVMLVEDISVPRTQIGALLDVIAEIADRNDVFIATAGHAVNGNLHPTVVFDCADAESEKRAMTAYDEVMAAALQLGGTSTGEHGVGLMKKEWLAKELDPIAMQLHRDIKALLDPMGILNPGKVL